MPPGNAKVARTFRFPRELSDAINERAARKGVPYTDEAVWLLQAGLAAPDENGGPAGADVLLDRLRRVQVPLRDDELAQTVPDPEARREALEHLSRLGLVTPRMWKAAG